MKVLSFKDGLLSSNAGAFIDNIESLATTQSASPILKATDAVNAAFAEEKLAAPILNANTGTNSKFDFGQPANVVEKVTGELMWLPVEVDGKIKSVNLVWAVFVAPKETADMWQILVDATNGNIIGKHNFTVSDNWDIKNARNVKANNNHIINEKLVLNNNTISSNSPSTVVDASYLVIPYPAESPTHPGGTAAIRLNPWTAAVGNASALGWHSNGTTDYTISRGNNVWATEDQAATNQNVGPAAVSSTSPNPLTFNFPPVYTTDPRNAAFQQFAITNLFYWNNIMHDINYIYGFDEVAGNFQSNNQGRGGNGGDDVIALAQSGAAGSIGNNANFSTPPDGGRPRMRMYLFNGVPSAIVHVNTPVITSPNFNAIEGALSTANLITNVGSVTGNVVLFNDDAAGNTHYACGAPANSVTGKIALISRGFGGAVCSSATNATFVIKIKAAQDAGAIGVIMINNVTTAPITMGGSDNTITIPAVMVSLVDGSALVDLLPGLNVTLGPGIPFDGDLDNGVISHEYGHGISNRLTGGPANTSCLGNAEEGGEGWSDYLGLMVTTNWSTATLTDGALARPIGNYVTGQPATTGTGIRNFPYSTNIVTNPLTYANMGTGTIGTEVHNIGEIWCMAIWEMTWAIIGQEGVINPNLYNFSPATLGGNSIALKLVLEGMKLQPCSPGYVDARNAILAADRNLYAGRHACAIWTAFAKRGLGFGASQGSSNSATDQTASTTMPPAPTIATQPLDISVAAGANASFTANAGADVNLIYNWQVSTDGGTTWTNVSPATITPTLTLTAVTSGMNNNKYRCQVFIGCAITTSNVALLTVTGGATPPVITTQPTATTVCAGANVTFTSAASGTGVTYNWEVSTNGGTTWVSVTPAATTTTLTLNAVTTAMNNNRYRMVATNGSGSAPSNGAILTVNAIPAAPTVTATIAYCQGATASALTATGTGLLWYTTATGGTGSATAPTPSTTTTGTTTYYVSQTLSTCESPRAAIAVTVNATPAAPTATSPVAYCQGSTAIALTATGTGLLWYTTATGGTGSATAPTPVTTIVGSTTYYVSSTLGTCEGSRAAIVVNITATPAAPTVTTPITYCQGSTAIALTATGTNLLWYTTATGGTGSATAPTPSTAVVGTTTYYVSQTTGCEGPRAAILVSVIAATAAPSVVTPVSYCQNTTAIALSATGTNLKWYTTATGGVGSTTAPIPSTVTAGTFIFYVTQTLGICESPRAPITVIIVTTPGVPTVVTPVNYCIGATATPLVVVIPSPLDPSIEYRWFTTATGGVGSLTPPTPLTTTLGSTIYYVSAANITPPYVCEGPRAAITVNITAVPTAPTVTSPITYCQGSIATALTATGTNLLWYTTATGGTGSSTAPIPSTTTVGNTSYFVSQTTACASARAEIVVSVIAATAAPTATSPVVYCQGTTATALTATGTNLLWYTTATGGTGSTTTPTPSTTTVGNTIYYVTQTIGICESPRTAITVTVNAIPLAPAVITPVNYCQNVTAVPLSATGSNLKWYPTATGGVGSATAPTPITTILGTTIYYVSQTVGTCEGPRAAISVIVAAVSPAPTVVSPVTYCQNATAVPLTATGTNLLWYTTATGGTGSTSAPTPSTTTVGSTIYYVTQNSTCGESVRTALTVVVNATPAAPTATAAISYCQGATATVLTATGTNLLWYTVPTGGTGSATAPTPTTATAGVTNYYVSQSLLGCESPRTLITVTVTALPALPTVVSPITYCVGATASVLSATGTGLKWYTTPTGGVGNATAPTPLTTTIGTTTYYVSQTSGTCESGRAAIVVNVTAVTAAPTVTSPVVYCQGATPTALVATGTGLLWYTAATGGTGSATAPSVSTATVGTTTYYVSQTGNCESPRATIVVTVNVTPAAPVVTGAISYCQGSPAVPLTATGTGLLWYTTATGGTGSATAPTPNTTATGSTTYYVSQTTGVCEGPRAAITVSVTSAPAITSQPLDITSCGTTATFSVTATGTGLTYQWFVSTNGGTTYSPISGEISNTLIVSGLTPAQAGYKYRVVVSSGTCTAATSNAVTARIGINPVVVLTAAPTANFNPYTNGGLYTTISPAGNYTYQWKRNNNVLTNTGTSITRVNGLLDDFGSYIVTVTDAVTGCIGVSNAVSVSDIAGTRDQLFVWPNPTTGLVKVSFYSSAIAPQGYSVNVYDEKGARVLLKDITLTGRYGSANIDITRLAAGNYVIVLLDAAGNKIATDRVVKY
jgi:Fungalysin metallopeptidase (M36)/PA domain/Ig-like domain CHU_C associated